MTLGRRVGQGVARGAPFRFTVDCVPTDLQLEVTATALLAAGCESPGARPPGRAAWRLLRDRRLPDCQMVVDGEANFHVPRASAARHDRRASGVRARAESASTGGHA
jgi:hypothetical protein